MRDLELPKLLPKCPGCGSEIRGIYVGREEIKSRLYHHCDELIVFECGARFELDYGREPRCADICKAVHAKALKLREELHSSPHIRERDSHYEEPPTLRRVPHRFCPVCGSDAKSFDIWGPHCCGQWNESVTFECGSKYHYSPNSQKVELESPCSQAYDVLKKLEKMPKPTNVVKFEAKKTST